MSLLGKFRNACGTPPAPGFAVTNIPATEVRAGMTIVAMSKGWMNVRPDGGGHWPVVIEDAEFEEHGEGGVPCVYWLTDEPESLNGYWCFPETMITVAAASDGRPFRDGVRS